MLTAACGQAALQHHRQLCYLIVRLKADTTPIHSSLLPITLKKPPAGGFFLFFKMHVAENMVGAIAPIACAAAAIAEVQIGILGIRLAADAALVIVPLGGLAGLGGGLTVLHRLRTMACGGAVYAVAHLGIDKHGEVKKRHHRQHHAAPVTGDKCRDDLKDEQRSVQPRQPLHLHGNDEEQQHLRVREEAGEGEEQGEVHVGGACNGVRNTRNEGGHHDADGGQENTRDIVEGKLGSAPLALEGRADPVVEIQRNQHEEEAAAGGDEHIGEDAPNFPLQHHACVHVEEGQGKGVIGGGEHLQDIDEDVADGDIEHQVGDAKTGMAGAETLHPIVEFFQVLFLLQGR